MKTDSRRGFLGVLAGSICGLGGISFSALFDHVDSARKIGQPPVVTLAVGSVLIVAFLSVVALISLWALNRGSGRERETAVKDNW